jgi:hypothetical protein
MNFPTVMTANYTPSSYSWDKSSNLTLVSTSGNTATFSGNTAGAGWVSIKVNNVEIVRKNVSVVCCTAPAISAFAISGGSFAFSPGYLVGCCPGDYVYLTPQYPSSVTPVDFQYQATNCTLSNSSSSGTTVHAPAGIHQGFTVEYRYKVSDGCWSPWFTLYGNTLDCANGEEPYSPASAPASAVSGLAQVYPSLVADVLNIAFDAVKVSQAKAAAQTTRVFTFDISLYDNLGTLHRQATSTGESVTFDVSGLRNGIYFLHVSTPSGKSEVHKVIVSH